MKICGCSECKKRGEINLLEEFENYLENREFCEEKEFEDIFRRSYTVQEMTKLYDELESKFETDVVQRINQHVPFDAHAYWQSYGGSLGAFQNLMEE